MNDKRPLNINNILFAWIEMRIIKCTRCAMYGKCILRLMKCSGICGALRLPGIFNGCAICIRTQKRIFSFLISLRCPHFHTQMHIMLKVYVVSAFVARVPRQICMKLTVWNVSKCFWQTYGYSLSVCLQILNAK